MSGPLRRLRARLAVLLVALAGCVPLPSHDVPPPACVDAPRLGLVAQAVPGAAYVPCRGSLADGWRATRFSAQTGSATWTLLPPAGAPVLVRYAARCPRGGTPVAPRADGVVTTLRLSAVAPVYAGTLTDRFAGGCVTTRFSFPRGPHIPAMEQLSDAVGLLPRHELAATLRRRLGVRLDP